MPASDANSGASTARKQGFGVLDQKVQSKINLQEEFGWPKEPKRPVLCLPAGMTEALGGKLFQDVLPGILSLPLEILVVGRGTPAYGTLFTKLAKEHRHRVSIVSDNAESIEKMYNAADMALFLSDDLPVRELSHCLEMGVVPVSRDHALLEDYDPVQEAGNAFTYQSLTRWHCFAALVRAVETHKFPFDWRTIQRHGIEGMREK